MRDNGTDYTERILRDPGVCGGEPVLRGTRVTLRTVLASLAAGDSPEELTAEFPSLKIEDIRAAIAFAAASAQEDIPIPAIALPFDDRSSCDENLPVSMASHLRTLGHDVDTTLDEQLTGRPDTDVWNAAQRELRFLVTQDFELSDIRTFEPGKHKGILLDSACTRPTDKA